MRTRYERFAEQLPVSTGERVAMGLGGGALCYFVFWGCAGPLAMAPAPIDAGERISRHTGQMTQRKNTMALQGSGGAMLGLGKPEPDQTPDDFAGDNPDAADDQRDFVYANYGVTFSHLFRARVGLEFGPVVYFARSQGLGAGMRIRYFIRAGERFRIAPEISGGLAWADVTLPMATALGEGHWLHYSAGVRYSFAGWIVPVTVGWRWQDPHSPFGVQVDVGALYVNTAMATESLLLNGRFTHQLLPTVTVSPTWHF